MENSRYINPASNLGSNHLSVMAVSNMYNLNRNSNPNRSSSHSTTPIPRELDLVTSPKRTKKGKSILLNGAVLTEVEKNLISKEKEKRHERQISRGRDKKNFLKTHWIPQSGRSTPDPYNFSLEPHGSDDASWTEKVVFSNVTMAEAMEMEKSDCFLTYNEYGPAEVGWTTPSGDFKNRQIKFYPHPDIYELIFAPFSQEEILELRTYGIPLTLDGTRPKFINYSVQLPNDHPLHIDNRKKPYIKEIIRWAAQGGRRDQHPPNALCGDLGSTHYNSLSDGGFEPQVGFFDSLPSMPSMPSVPNLVPSVSLDDSTKNLINNFTMTLQNMVDKMDKSKIKIEVAEEALQSIDGVASNVSDLTIVLMIGAILCVFKPETKMEKVCLSMMVLTYVSSRVGLKGLWENSGLSSYFSKPVEVEPQSGMVDLIDDTCVVVAGLFSSYICYQSGTQMFNPKELARVVGICGKMKLGIRSITDAISLLVNYLHSSIDSWYNKTPFFVRSGYDFIDAFLIEAKTIMTMAEDKTLLNVQSSLDRVRACIEVGESIVIKIPGSSDTVGLRMHVNNTVAELRKVKTMLINTNFKFSGLRTEPVALLLRGAPGVGKSQAMQHLAHAINALTLDKVDFSNYMESPGTATYNRQAENVYWEGYKQNMNIVFMDDLGQGTEVAGSPDCESMNLIRMVNIFENQLHMAGMEGKGNTTFRSRFVIANTNKRTFNFVAISEGGAFMRRWDIVVDVVPKAEYCIDPSLAPWDRRFDRSKLPIYGPGSPGGSNPANAHLFGTSVMTPDLCEYHVQKLNSDISCPQFEDAGRVVEFQEVVMMFYNRWLEKSKFHEVYGEFLGDTASRYRDIAEQPDFAPQIGPTPLTQMQSMEAIDISTDVDQIRDLNLNPHNRVKLDILRHDDPPKYNATIAACYTVESAIAASGLFVPNDDILNIVLQTEVPPPGTQEFIDVLTGVVTKMVLKGKCQYLIRWPAVKAKFDEFIGAGDRFSQKEDTPWFAKKVFEIFKFTYSAVLYFADRATDIAISGLVTYSRTIISLAPNSPLVQALIAFTGGTIAWNLAVCLVRTLLTQSGLDNEPESDSRSDRIRHTRTRIPRAKIQANASKVSFVPQSLTRVNENMSAIIRKVTYGNTYEIWAPTDLTDKHYSKMGFAIGLKGRSLLLPYHFCDTIVHDKTEGAISGDAKIFMYRPAVDYKEFILTVDEFIESFKHWGPGEQQDLAVICMPKRFNPIADITKYIATDAQLKSQRTFEGVLTVPASLDRAAGTWRVMEWHSLKVKPMVNQTVSSDAYEPYTVKEAFLYDAPTSAGDCGSLLFMNDPSKSQCITGMHVAGAASLKVGFSARISKEFIDRFLEFVGETYEHIDQYNVDLDVPAISPDNMVAIGKFKPQTARPKANGNTKIVQSPLYGLVSPVKRAPAQLKPFVNSDGIRVDPMARALEKYCKEETYISPLSINAAITSTFDMMETNSRNKVERLVLDFETAVLGNDSGHFNAVPRNTSAGYPYNVMGGDPTKARFFGKEDLYDLYNDEAIQLKAEVDLTINLAEKGKRVMHYFTDHLKDERRSIKKVQAGDTRLISGCPTTLLVCFRMYFGAFQEWMTANRIHNGMLIGINEYSHEWNVLGRYLERFGVEANNIGAGDYRGFDMSHNNAVAWGILRGINDWYDDGPTNARVRATLWEEIVNSQHMTPDGVFSWKHPLPSGAPPTTAFNCVANHTYFRLCWMDIIHPEERQAHDFNNHVVLQVLGDDNAFAVSSQYKSIFTEKAIARSMAKLGQTYTPEDKDKVDFDDKLRNLTEITLLKRRFYKHPKVGLYVAPLDLETILDLVNWTKKGVDRLSIAQTNCDIFLEELSLHPKEQFDTWKRALLRAIDQTEGELHRPPITDYDELFRSVHGRERYSEVEQRFLSDYDNLVYKIPGEQNQAGRFREEQASLFRLTSRTTCWQPQSSPGNQGSSRRLVPRAGLNGTATTHDGPSGLQTDSVIVVHDGGSAAQTSGTTHSTVMEDAPWGSMTTYVPLSRDVLNSAVTLPTQSIVDFLAKPVMISHSSLATNDVHSTTKFAAIIPQGLIYNTPIWADKLKGHYAFKGELHITVTVNATRFQQGRYILAWVPSGGATNEDKFARAHTASLVQISQLPHVELDINCDSEASLVIPHVTAQGWAALDFNNSSLYGNNGRVIFTSYSPLSAVTGSTTAGYCVMAHWEKVELAMPINPQSGRVGSRVRRKANVSEQEQKSAGVGGISSTLSLVTSAASTLAGIPLLSSVAAPVAWATDIAARTARSFGWSKPHNSASAQLGNPSVLIKYTNCDTIDSSTKLGFTDSNHIEDLPGFAGSDLDEMSISYLTSISSYFQTVNWTAANAINESIWSKEISPRLFYTTTTTNTTPLYHLSTLSYVSGLFALYRGSFKLTVKLVKTEFHTGRLSLAFYPRDANVNSGYPMASIQNAAPYVHREIIDVRDGNEFTFIIPYMSLTPYRATGGTDSAYGFLQMTIINPLVAPSTVPPNVTMLFEISGHTDLEFAQPSNHSGSFCMPFVPQSGRDSGRTCEIVNGVLGEAQTHESNSARLCIGERILSLRSLAKRFNRLVFTSGNPPNTFCSYMPFQADVGHVATGTFEVAPYAPDMYTACCSMYALFRGGVRIKVVTHQSTAAVLPQAFAAPSIGTLPTGVKNFYFNTTVQAPVPTIGGPATANAFFRTETSGGVEVEHPFYNRTHSATCADLLNCDSTVSTAIKLNPNGPIPRTTGFIHYRTTLTTEPSFFRAMAEDASFGLFVSIMPIAQWSDSQLF